MTNDQPPFTIPELGAKFGELLSATIAEMITLEKFVEKQRQQIQEMTTHENALIDNVQNLEQELADWKSDFYEIEGELAELKRSTSNVAGLSSALAEMAAEGKAAIDGV